MEKFCRAGLVTYDNMAHAHCMLGTQGYRHTLRVCNTHCFSAVNIVTRVRLNVKLYVHLMSGFYPATTSRAVPQVISRWLLPKETPVQSHVNTPGMYGPQSCIVAYFSLGNPSFPLCVCVCQSSSGPYPSM